MSEPMFILILQDRWGRPIYAITDAPDQMRAWIVEFRHETEEEKSARKRADNAVCYEVVRVVP